MRPFPRITILATLALTLLAFPAQARHVHHQTQAYRPIIDVAAIPPYPLDQAQRHAYRPTEAVRGRIYRVRGTITITVQKRRQGASNRAAVAPDAVTYLAHPAGCPRIAFCACGAAVEIFGEARRYLWPAAAWYGFPRAAPGYGMVAVRAHHVFVLHEHISGSIYMTADYNSGGHRSRLHAQSIAGYTIVDPHGSSAARHHSRRYRVARQ